MIAQGIALPEGNAGQIAHSGVTVSYAYDGRQLGVVIVHKPVLVPESMIESRIREWFATSMQA